MATLAQLEAGLVEAYRRKDMDKARKLAVVVQRARQDQSLSIPGAEGANVEGTSAPAPEPTIAARAIGVAETARAAVGGLTAPLAAAGGLAVGAYNTLTGQPGTSAEAAQALSETLMRPFTPETPEGQRYTQALGEATSFIPPVIPLAGELGMLARGAAPTAQAVRSMAVPAAVQRMQQVAAPIQKAAQTVIQPVRETVQAMRGQPTGRAGDMGAAQTAAELVKRERAAAMPVPFQGESGLTKGQAMSGPEKFEQTQFERETAKLPEGGDLRQRALNQREVLEQNFDALADVANPNAIELPDIGSAADRALVNSANVKKAAIRREFQKADAAGEMMEPVDMTPIIAALTDAERFPGVAPLVQAIRREAERFGALTQDADGNVTGARIPIRDAEAIRQFVNDKRTIDWANPKEAAIGRIIKNAIDDATEAAGGDIYRNARAMRRKFAQEFENNALTRDLLAKKRGTDDRKIAIENVYDRVIVRSSVEEMNKLRATLLKAGDDGKQAWANLKAKAIDEIKNAGLTRAINENDQRTFSPAALNKAIQRFDQSGKLEALFGKKQAATIRDLGTIANDIMLAPPGSVNFSNTASALRVALDTFGTFMFTGVPAPAATALREGAKYVRDAKTRARITEALRDPGITKQQPSGKF